MKKLEAVLVSCMFCLSSLSVLQAEEAISWHEPRIGLKLDELSLKTAQEYLLSNHPRFLAVLASEESAHQLYLQAWSAWLPSVNATANFKDDQLPGYYASGLGFSQTLFDNSSYWAVRLKKIDWAIAKAQVANLKNDLLYELRASYYGLIVGTQELKAAEENVQLLQASFQREKDRFELGDTTSFHLNQSKVALSNSLADLYASRSGLKKAHQRLLLALGIEPSQIASSLCLTESEIPVHSMALVQDQLQKLEGGQMDEVFSEKELWQQSSSLFSEATRQYYIELALKKSPQVRTSEAKVDRAAMTSKSRLGEYLPSLSASASYDNMGSRSNNNPFEGRYSASVGVSLKWTLFDGLARERRLSQSRWDKLAVEEDHRQISYLTKQNVLNSFYELEQGCQTYIASKLGVKLAQEAMEQASHQRTWGVISPLEYREAASLLTKSKRDFAKSSYELMMAYYRLVYNTGEDVASDYVEIEKTLQQAQD
jgi:outer membrane protein TolC